MKKLMSLLLALVMVFALTACGSKAPPEVPSENPTGTPTAPVSIDTLVVGTTAKIVTANRSEYNFDVISGTLSQLAPIYLDEAGEYKPLLCDFKTTDSKIWTLTVRDGMKWHDGTPVTAEDIAFTLTYLDTQTEGGYADSYADIKVIDDKNIELSLEKPNPRQLSSLTTLRIMPKHIYDGVADYTTVANEQANIGCGPYKFIRFDANAGVVEFAAVSDYADGKPSVNKIMLKLFDSADTMYMALKSGDVDMIYKYSGGVEPAVIADLEASGNLTLMPIKNTANSASLIFNNNTAPGNDVNIRRAIACAIDYAKFRELFGSSYSVPSTAGFIPVGTPGYVAKDELKRDVEKAKELLKTAGCTDSNGDGYVEYKGAKLTLPIMLRDDKPEHTRYAELLVNNLKEVGIEVVLDVQEVANFRTKTEKERSQVAVITGLTPFGMAKSQGMASLYLWGDYPMSYGQVYDEAYKTLLGKADAAANLEEYNAVAAEIQQYYADNIPAIALFWDSHVQAFSNSLEGFVVDGTFGIMNVQTWLNLTKK